MAPAVLARRFGLALAACAVLCGCGRPDARAARISASWTIEPAAPAAGAETVARVALLDAQQRPVRRARLQLEAHMSHPGMAPVIAPLAERGDGIYEARVQLTMAGDWTLVASGERAGGGRISEATTLRGVR